MLKKVMLFGLAVLLLTGVGYVVAQDTSNSATQQNPDQNQGTQNQGATHQMGTSSQSSTQISGVVDKIDKDKKTITVRDEASGQKKVLSFNDTTTFMNGTTAGSVSDLKKGQHVSLQVDAYNMITRADLGSSSSTTSPSSSNPSTPPQQH